MVISARFDSRNLERGLRRLAQQYGKRVAEQAGLVAAEAIMGEARRKAPFRFGELRDSDVVEVQNRGGRRGEGGKEVIFGFNKSYAAVMDRGWRVPYIEPVRASGLWIPLTRRAARRGPQKRGGNVRRKTRRNRGGNSRASTSNPKVRGIGRGRGGGRQAGRRQDFIIVPRVKTRKARPGSKTGPNFYFTNTVNKHLRSGRTIANMGKVAQRLLRESTNGNS